MIALENQYTQLIIWGRAILGMRLLQVGYSLFAQSAVAKGLGQCHLIMVT